MTQHTQHTPGPWHVGAQNDALYITAGRSPALDNDYPWHDAPRVCLAKVYGPCVSDCLPVNELANAKLIALAPDMLAMLEQVAEGQALHSDILDLLEKAKGVAA